MDKINEKIVTFLDPQTIEPSIKQQLLNTAELPFVFKHIAVMPDCHLGKGATVASVIATKGAVIPAFEFSLNGDHSTRTDYENCRAVRLGGL